VSYRRTSFAVTCAAVSLAALTVACGPRPRSRTAGDETPPAGAAASAEQPAGGGDAAHVPCETSDDCPEGQTCVDDECAVVVPAGFY
jgi:hypothetical protein